VRRPTGRGCTSFDRSTFVDLVEVHVQGDRCRFVPVETKRGARERHANDEVQLCAQAMALEEMTGTAIGEGAIFHARSKRRRIVRFTPDLRVQTERAAARLHAIIDAREVPAAVFDDKCRSCSLREACQPESSAATGALATALRRALT